MTRKKTLKDYSPEQLQAALAARFADQHYRPGMTMSQMELAIWDEYGMENASAARALAALLERMPLEKPTSKLCPKCGKRTPVKARDRVRTLRTMAGPVTLTRSYHYCERCSLGFYPMDRLLDLPEQGELTSEMEKRVLDFAINDVFDQGAARWNLHYRHAISDNLLRRVAARVGAECEAADQGHLQEALVHELMDCVPEVEHRRRDKREALKAIDHLIRYYRNNAHRMKYRLFREHGFLIGSGAVESAHRHVLQCRMKRAGQRWNPRERATHGPPARSVQNWRRCEPAPGDPARPARNGPRRSLPNRRRHGFRFARQGIRDRIRSSN